MADLKNISIIGLGQMGHGMATNLIKAGFTLMGYDHPSNQNCDDLTAIGAVLTNDMGELLQAADVLIICVTGSRDVDAVLYGDGGVTAHAQSGLIIMDCTTGLPQDTRKRAEELKSHGITFFDAAMTRTPKEAAEGRLNLILGGNANTLDYCRPIFTAIAEVVTTAGDVGAGQEAKLLHNFVSLGFSAILGEAAGRADAMGFDRNTFLELIGKGGGSGAIFDRFKPYLEDGDTEAFRFSMANAVKDLGYYNAMISRQDGVSVAPAVLALLDDARVRQGDNAAIPQLVDGFAASKKDK